MNYLIDQVIKTGEGNEFLLGIIYLSFISLGLPDALLGAAWPNMYPEFQVPVSYAGAIPYGLGAGYHFDRHYSDAASFWGNSIADRKPYIYQAVAGVFIPFPGTYGIYA